MMNLSWRTLKSPASWGLAALVGAAVFAAANPPVPAQPRRPAIRVQKIYVTADDVARLARGKQLVLDLSGRGTVYEFDSRTRMIDLSRIMVRTARGEIKLESWLSRQVLAAAGSGWKSGRFRIGRTDVLKNSGAGKPGRSGVLPYECSGSACACAGHDDCINMFNDPVCGPNSFCDDSDPNNPRCWCW